MRPAFIRAQVEKKLCTACKMTLNLEVWKVAFIADSCSKKVVYDILLNIVDRDAIVNEIAQPGTRYVQRMCYSSQSTMGGTDIP